MGPILLISELGWGFRQSYHLKFHFDSLIYIYIPSCKILQDLQVRYAAWDVRSFEMSVVVDETVENVIN